MARNCLLVYHDWLEALKPFSDEEVGRLIRALLFYSMTDEEKQDSLIGNEKYIYPMFKLQVDRNKEAYEEFCSKQRQNGAKGGRPKKQEVLNETQNKPENPTVLEETQITQRFSEKPKKPNININNNININDNIKKVLGDESPAPPKPRFVKPTVEEVEAYCRERKNNVDAQKFVDFYDSKNWMIGKTKMSDWKASVRTWESREKNNAPAYANKKPAGWAVTGEPGAEELETIRAMFGNG